MTLVVFVSNAGYAFLDPTLEPHLTSVSLHTLGELGRLNGPLSVSTVSSASRFHVLAGRRDLHCSSATMGVPD